MLGKEEIDAVLRVMGSSELSGYSGHYNEKFYGGREIASFEKEWAEYFGVKHAIACNSGTSGLWMACNAIGLGTAGRMIERINGSSGKELPQYEVIVPASGFISSATIPLLFDAKPVFADIEPDYYCLDPESVERNITENTRAILAVDLFGMPYDADKINSIAEKYGLYVIEDSAEAVGGKYKGRYTGTLGHIGVYSLNHRKHIHTGEGGVVVTNDDDLAWKVRLSLNHGEAVEFDMDPPYSHIVGMNFRMTEISAAIAREQLKKLGRLLDMYASYAAWFDIPVREQCISAYYRFVPATKNGEARIMPPHTMEEAEKIFIFKKGFFTPLYRIPLFKAMGYPQDLCPVSEEVEADIVLASLKEPL